MTDQHANGSDHSLLRRLKTGEPDAATALYLKYAEHLRAVVARQSSAKLASRLDSDDIVQSVFRSFFRRVIRDHYVIPRGEDLWKLILVIALHKVRNAGTRHRAAKRDVERTTPIDAAESLGEMPTAPDETALATLRLVIDEITETWPESSRRIIELRVNGHEIGEIADRAGRSKRSVERVLQRFREQLKETLYE